MQIGEAILLHCTGQHPVHLLVPMGAKPKERRWLCPELQNWEQYIVYTTGTVYTTMPRLQFTLALNSTCYLALYILSNLLATTQSAGLS